MDVYPAPIENPAIDLPFDYIYKLSGKKYEMNAVLQILQGLDFSILSQDERSLRVKAPSSKSDIHHPCDIVEEIMRIDGLDNISIPSGIRIAPSISKDRGARKAKEEIANRLSSLGFQEILTNSIIDSKQYPEGHLVTMMNSLSSELDALRPSMAESGLQAIGFNLNRQQNDLKFYEFGKVYSRSAEGKFSESTVLALWVTGHIRQTGWREKEQEADFFFLKGILGNLLQRLGLGEPDYTAASADNLNSAAVISIGGQTIGRIGLMNDTALKNAEIKSRTVWYAELYWEMLIGQAPSSLTYQEISRFPAVERDLALIVDRQTTYSQMRVTALNLKIHTFIRPF
jgi:phenylalanyl-tRNA synthetase beta chain